MAAEVQQLIQVVNKLQDVFASFGSSCPIDLPQIAVVGEQSAGKSSVLENFVGKDFLPRGSGIVTRRPLILQLINQNGPEYAEFLHCKDRRFTDFLEVRKEIEVETDRLTGSNKNISAVPINLRVYSPNVLNLTLIDLPGLTKVPVGDQPKDIEYQIREMIVTYISSPNCLILAVTPAVIDLANSEALKLAREVDPEKLRTIGVITKIDMMDQGTDCKAVLENNVYELRRGFVGIVNRSQRDIDGKKDIHAAQESEHRFFASHPVYRNLANRMGSKFLQETLNKQLSQHIKETLPSLRQKLLEKIGSIEKEAGPNLYDLREMTPSEKGKILMKVIQDFSKQVDAILGYQQEIVDTSELSGGSIINKILYQRLRYEIQRSIPNPSKIKTQIGMAIRNSQGVRNTIFTSDVAFISVMRRQIEDTRSPCMRVPELIANEARKILEKACSENFGPYPVLLDEIMSFCQQRLGETLKEAKEHINFYIDIEVSHINTNHPDFKVYDELDDSGQPTESNNPNPSKAMGRIQENNMYRKGYMQILTQGLFKSSKQEYFVLKGSTLTSYKDERLLEPRLQVSVDSCRIKDYETNYSTKRNVFQLYHKDSKFMGKDVKHIDFSCSSNDEAEEWKAAFLAAGVATDRKDEPASKDADSTKTDVTLMRQVQYIFALVEAYLKIITKNEVDIVAKICIYTIITKLRESLITDVPAHVYSVKPIDELIKESEEVAIKRKETADMHKSCKEALAIITSVMSNSNIGFSTRSNMKMAGSTSHLVSETEDRHSFGMEGLSSQLPPIKSSQSNTNLNKEMDNLSSASIYSNSKFYVGGGENEATNTPTMKRPNKPQRPPPKS